MSAFAANTEKGIITLTPDDLSHGAVSGTDWKYDGMNHWHECISGAKAEATAHTCGG